MAVHNVSQTEIIRRRYNRTALFYDWMDKMISPRLRRQAIELAEGKVLEVGVGTGQNLPFYQGDCEVTGIDFSPGMLRKAQARLRLAKVPVKLLEMDAQAMSFADETFDTVVATCVFCSVPDPVQGLREIKRVCKKKRENNFTGACPERQSAAGLAYGFVKPCFAVFDRLEY